MYFVFFKNYLIECKKHAHKFEQDNYKKLFVPKASKSGGASG